MIPTWAIRTKADEKAIEEGCYWDQSRADDIITFAERFFKPQYIKGKFTLLEWQQRFLSSLYAWRQPNHVRRFNVANLHISKKQGKTLLCSIISCYEMVKSEEQSPYVATASVSRGNATQVFNELRYALRSAKLDKFCKITASKKMIRFDKLNADYQALSSDGTYNEGFNLSCCIVDEAHAHKSDKLYKTLRYAHCARTNGMLVIISTAGNNPTHFYHDEVYLKSKKILAGVDLDTSWYAEVYESDINANAEDPKEWYKACPSMGVSFTEASFKKELLSAKESPGAWNNFQRYRLNRWVLAHEKAFFCVTTWDKGKQVIPDDHLAKYDSFVAVDLSMTTDPSSISQVFCLPERNFYCKSWGWVAREGVVKRNKSNLPLYDKWVSEGSLTITEGDRIDDLAIYAHLLRLKKQFNVKKVIFDPTSAMMMMGMLQAEGMDVERMSQTHRYYSAPMKELSKAIQEGRMKHDGNNWLRYCLNNIRVDEDRSGNIRPNKGKSIDKIDGAIALLMAFSQAAAASVGTQKSIYEDRGVLWV